MPVINVVCAGFRIRIESDREEAPFRSVAADLAALVDNDAAFSGNATPDARILLLPRRWDEPSPLKLPPNAQLVRAGGRKVFQHGNRFFIDFHENAFFELDGLTATGVCYSDERVDPMFWTELSVNHVLFLLLMRLGRFPLHAGGAVRPDGTAMLMLGESGAGKTTATLSLVAAHGAAHGEKNGWPFLGDDFVLWDAAGRIYPFAKAPAASPWTVAATGLASRVCGARRTGKQLLTPWPPAPPCDNARLYLVSPAPDGKNRVEPVNADFAAEFLTTQTSLCVTDRLLGAPTPDLAPFVRRLQRLWVGDLRTLPDFLMAQV